MVTIGKFPKVPDFVTILQVSRLNYLKFLDPE